jgi:flagellar hook-length control protein FliK
MSAAAPSFSALNLPAAAGAAPPAAGVDAAGPMELPNLAFQLLIAELGTPAPGNTALTPQLAGSQLPSTERPERAPAKKTTDDGDEALLAALAALCAWQAPAVAPAQIAATAAGTSDSTDSTLPTATPATDAGVQAAAIDAVAGLELKIDTATAPPQKRVAIDTNLPAIQPDGGAAARQQAGNVFSVPVATANADALLAAASAASDPPRAKSTDASSEPAPALTDTLANGNLLMRAPVINPTATRTVSVPVHDPRWPDAVATQIRWAINDGVQSATLKLVPADLGPVELHIELKDNQVNVNFGANQADTRQALQDSLPRLREVLAGAGITLGQANVQQDSGRASQFAGNTTRASRDDTLEPALVSARVALGLIDEYA